MYIATRQAVDHIEYWAERFTSENGYKPLQTKVVYLVEPETSLKETPCEFNELVESSDYYDERAFDKHLAVGGTSDAKWGFADCALPIVLSHNTPNNSVYALW